MSKKWKTTLANKFLQLYTQFSSRLKPIESFDPQRKFSSILIYSTTALGDLMFNTPAIRAIKQRYPQATITLISSYKNRGLVAKSAYFDNVVYWDEKAKDMRRVVKELRKTQPELAIILHSKPPYDVISAVLSGCEYIIKDVYGTKPSGIEKWLTHYITGYNGHLIQRKLDVVSFLNCDVSNRDMFIPVDFPLIAKDADKITIGFQMGASEPLRCWPVAKFIELARYILALGPQYEIALIGTLKERDHETTFLNAMSEVDKQRIVSHIAKTNLEQLLGIMRNMDVLVTGDTGPLHLAVALKTKTVSLFVTANPEHTGPYQDPDLHQIMSVSTDVSTLPAAMQAQPLGIIDAAQVLAHINKLLIKA